MKLCLCLILCLEFVLNVLCKEYAVPLEIPQGKLEGYSMISSYENEYYAFIGIPYAKPPVGQLRFKPPEEATSWKGTLVATAMPSECIQWNIFKPGDKLMGKEDCLHLNVFTRNVESFNTSNAPLLNVMVYFHGGGFMSGSGSPQVYGPQHFMNKDIVLVTVNSRVGIMGFLSTGDSVVPGNMGLKDQVMALKWVQKNIKYFGGNPDSVTIFGQGSGGSSVHYHMMSPLSKDLFHRGISQSGTAFNSWAYLDPEVANKRSKRLGKILKCKADNNEDLVNCLKLKEAAEIVRATKKFMKWSIFPLSAFAPTLEENIEGSFLTEKPRDAHNKHKVNNVPWIVGTTSNEAIVLAAAFFTDKNLNKDFEKNYKKYLPHILHYIDEQNQDEITEKITKFYFQKDRVKKENPVELLRAMSDRLFLTAFYEALFFRKLSNTTSNTYGYQFKYKGSYKYTAYLEGFNAEKYGASHGEDLNYFFKSNFMPSVKKLDKSDVTISDTLVDWWTTFADSGTPMSDKSVLWKPITDTDDPEEIKLMSVDLKTEMFSEDVAERLNFWFNIYNNTVNNSETSQKDEL